MILPEQQTQLKKLLRKGYAAEVATILEQREITNAKGNAFDYRTISAVFNGKRSNAYIEDAIFELYEKKKAVIIKRDALLEIKKPEAATSENS